MTLLLMSTHSFGLQAFAENPINLEVKSAILVDAKTGTILYKMNETAPLDPASMTKMMTELLVLEAIENGKIQWNDKVKTDDYGFFLGKNGGSRVYLNLGEERTVRELYEAMAIYSANDATAMLAEHIAGSEEDFVSFMNQKAEDLGMETAHFRTSSGFPYEELKEYAPHVSGEHVMSAKDTAILARELITKHPDALKIASIPKKDFREGSQKAVKMTNWNWMLPGLVYAYEGIDGLKTGHTDQAGYCFTGSATRNGIRLISVIMGAESEEKRFSETRKLLDYGFDHYKWKNAAPKDQAIEGHNKADVKNGKERQVEAVPESDLVFPMKTGEEKNYRQVVTYRDVMAPVKIGQPIGKVTIEYNGQDIIEYLRTVDKENGQVNLVAKQDVDAASGIRLWFRALGNFFGAIQSKVNEMV